MRAEQHRNRRAGWQHAHVAVDDHSRLAICELYPAEGAASCTAFLELAIAAFAARGIRIERVMTDNGNGYRSRAFRAALQRHGIRHLRTRPYTPRTNGKAEAFIRILQREWAYAFAYHSSAHRARALPGYIRWYNNHRPHGSLGGHPPINRVSQAAGPTPSPADRPGVSRRRCRGRSARCRRRRHRHHRRRRHRRHRRHRWCRA